jgi:hypothetical protein
LNSWIRSLRRKPLFRCFREYAKADVEDVLIKITAVIRAGSATLHLPPQFWYRNAHPGADLRRPIARGACVPGSSCVELQHWQYGKRWLLCDGRPELLFT